jgi:hypothetical protein
VLGDDRAVGGELDFPDALPAHAAHLLENERTTLAQPRRELRPQRLPVGIEPGVRPPAHLAGVDEHLLRPHALDDVGVRTDEHTCLRDLAQQRVEHGTVEPLLDRVHPDEHRVELEQLLANRLDLAIGVDDSLGLDPELREGGENAVQLRRLRGRRIPFSTPEQPDARLRSHETTLPPGPRKLPE